MKRIVSLSFIAVIVFSMIVFTGCNKKNEALQIGLGVHTSAEATDASEERNGSGVENSSVAAVLVDSEGRIVKCVIDCTDHTVSYTASGKTFANESFVTKYEQGDSYNMEQYGDVKAWYEQVDVFCSVVEEKTLSEVKALVAADGKGTDEVRNAGCVIAIFDFVSAIEKAMKGAVDSEATAKDTLKIGVFTSQQTSDATVDKNGSNHIETTLFAAALDGKNKIVAAKAECISVEFTFDAQGVSTFNTEQNVTLKYEKGDAYNMVRYGNAVKEWYAQADTFCAACIGKTVNEVNKLAGADNYAIPDVKAAGCTISVEGFLKAASKLK